jgi:hypothetical protein
VVAGTATASGRLGQPTDAMAVVEEATRGPATVVLRSTVPGLRIDEAVDFDDGGHLTDDRAPGIDITPYASGNHLSGKNGALMALLPAGAPANYQSCADIAVTDRVQTLLGTYGLPDGQRICLWTKPGRAVLMTLTRAPRQQQPEVIFDYVVWQGAAPVSPRPVAPMPADTNEDSYSLGSLTDEIGVNIDPGGGKVDPNSDMVDMSFNGKATKLKVERGALLALIPDGAPTAYATCTGVDPDKIKVGLDLQGRPAGFRFCLFAYSGRVALVSVSRTATPDLPSVDLDVVIWRGTFGADATSDEPAPWNRGPYTTDQRARIARGENPRRVAAAIHP